MCNKKLHSLKKLFKIIYQKKPRRPNLEKVIGLSWLFLCIRNVDELTSSSRRIVDEVVSSTFFRDIEKI